MKEKILAIDDDELLLKLIQKSLEAKGFEVHTAQGGEEGLELFHQVGPDLVILDVMMPHMGGMEVCRRLREISPVPIIFLTALDSEKKLVEGLEGGADDYLVKPFKASELIARVMALLRRARMTMDRPRVLRFRGEELIINCAQQTVFAHGEEISLSPIEYNLLLFMAERAGRILPTELLHQNIWGPNAETGSQSVKWYIWHLRQKIEADPRDPKFILTERGKGYRFSAQ